MATSAVVGDPLGRATQVRPLVSARQRDRMESYIAKGHADGARLTTGGGRPAGLDDGWFVEPTIFADVDNSTTIAQEEIFGPVLAIIRYDTIDDAVRIANDSPFGLAGTVWSPDRERASGVARRIRTGTVGFNGYSLDPVTPYGGVKDSGIGRELGTEGLASYQNLKSTSISPEVAGNSRKLDEPGGRRLFRRRPPGPVQGYMRNQCEWPWP